MYKNWNSHKVNCFSRAYSTFSCFCMLFSILRPWKWQKVFFKAQVNFKNCQKYEFLLKGWLKRNAKTNSFAYKKMQMIQSETFGGVDFLWKWVQNLVTEPIFEITMFIFSKLAIGPCTRFEWKKQSRRVALGTLPSSDGFRGLWGYMWLVGMLTSAHTCYRTPICRTIWLPSAHTSDCVVKHLVSSNSGEHHLGDITVASSLSSKRLLRPKSVSTTFIFATSTKTFLKYTSYWFCTWSSPERWSPFWAKNNL